MDACLDTLTTKLYQVNTRVSRIARRQVRMGGFIASPSPSPSLQASEDEDGDDGSGDMMMMIRMRMLALLVMRK